MHVCRAQAVHNDPLAAVAAMVPSLQPSSLSSQVQAAQRVQHADAGLASSRQQSLFQQLPVLEDLPTAVAACLAGSVCWTSLPHCLFW